MFFKSLYTRWDETNLRSITPQIEQRFRDRWTWVSRFGVLRFVLLAGLALAALMMAYDELLQVMLAPHRLVWSWDLASWGTLGFVFAPIYCVAMWAWSAKIENWRSTGRLNFPPAAERTAP